MRKKRIIVLISIVAILLVVAIVLFNKVQTERNDAINKDTLGIPIEVVLVKSENIQEAFNYTGTVKSKNQADLSFKLSGTMQKTFVAEGDNFEKGQVLAELNMEDLKARHRIVQQKASSARVNLDYSRDQANKNEILYNEGAISYQQFLDANYKYQIAESGYQEALAAVTEIEVSLKSAQICAPYNGIVREVLKQEGEIVQPGQLVFSVSENDDLIVEIAVIEKDLVAVEVGAKAVLYMNKGDKTELAEGTVSEISSTLNPETRTADIEILIPPGYEYLLPNMSVSVSLIKGEKENVLVVPVKALIENSEGTILYVYREGKALVREVKVGLNNGIMAEIVYGIKVGDQVITSTPTNIKNGDKVFVYKGVE